MGVVKSTVAQDLMPINYVSELNLLVNALVIGDHVDYEKRFYLHA